MRYTAPLLSIGTAVALAVGAVRMWSTIPAVSYVLGAACMWAAALGLSLLYADRPWAAHDRIFPKK